MAPYFTIKIIKLYHFLNQIKFNQCPTFETNKVTLFKDISITILKNLSFIFDNFEGHHKVKHERSEVNI